MNPTGEPADPDGPGRAWMLELQKGKDAAFDRIVIHYREAVHRFLSRSVRDPERVEDLAQETFLRVYRARDRYQPTAAFRTWLFTIATRLCLNELRSRRRERRVIVPMSGRRGTEDGEEDLLEQAGDDALETPEDALQRRELEEAVDSALEELPAGQRTALLLLRFEELSYREIAQAMGISVMAVKSLINRGREGLRRRLAPHLAPRETRTMPGGGDRQEGRST